MSTVLIGQEYRRNFVTYFISCSFNFAIGIALGKYIDKLCVRLTNQFGLSFVGSTVLQLFIMIGLLYFIELHISSLFAKEWQKTTPGIIFGFGFFIAQKTLNRNLESIL